MAKAASGFLSRSGCARLLALAAMASAARPLAAWLWAWARGYVELVVQNGGYDLGLPVRGMCAAAWCVVVAVFSLAAVCPGGREPADGRGRHRRLAEAPFLLWALLTPDGRATAWRALVWILLWPAELLAGLWVACWCLCAAVWAAMDFTICRRGRGDGGRR